MFRIAAAVAMLIGSAAHASESCAIPSGLSPAPAGPQEEQRILPVEKFVLAYYWWPENCATYPGEGCSQHFGFKLHGLWPDGAGETYPQFCRAPTALSRRTVRANWCMTPSVTLLQHEWAKHGTCHWPDERAFFADERRLADTVHLPDASALPKAGLTAGGLRDAIIAANPALPREALFVGTDNKQRLTEVRICLDRSYRPMPCEGGHVGAPDRVPVQVRAR